MSEDTALLRGLLWATEPTPEEIRAMAIEDLALLGDPRALNPLASLLWDPNPRVQASALRAVALFQHPRAEEILTLVVRHPRLPDALKIQALDGLLYQRTASARATVEAVSKDPRLPSALQSAALAVVARWDSPRK
ncbi:FruC protein [Stigmatella aurantiaca DW4/3-1]|uniref:FruC protein n=1 Tax=Stigmatella aurantiaca (strain DW4/3-1) TaxID=378806 RepID=E3FFG8_STIAD|nr:FruC protein [Stigmatella aurantiaca DW4/3-1]